MCFAVRPFRLQPPDASRRRFRTLPLSAAGFRACSLRSKHGLGFATCQQARHGIRPNRVHCRCGPAVRLPVLPTPPRGDAVPVGYKPESVCLKRTSTFLTKHTCRRTGTGWNNEWHVVLYKSVEDIAFHLVPGLLQVFVVLRSAFSLSWFESIRSVGNAMCGDRGEEVLVESGETC
jgi:hypothetical protein